MNESIHIPNNISSDNTKQPEKPLPPPRNRHERRARRKQDQARARKKARNATWRARAKSHAIDVMVRSMDCAHLSFSLKVPNRPVRHVTTSMDDLIDRWATAAGLSPESRDRLFGSLHKPLPTVTNTDGAS